MSIFDGIFKKNQVNQMPSLGTAGMLRWWGPQGKKYSDAYTWIIFNKIFSGVKNVQFTYDIAKLHISKDTKEGSLAELDNICSFLNTNANMLLWLYWSYGYIVTSKNKKDRFIIPDYAKLRRDANGMILDYDIVLYSEPYRLTGKSDFCTIRENVSNLDDLKNSENYLTTSLGALGVMSGKSMPINPSEKKEFLDDLKKNYGTTSDKYQILMFTNEVSLQQLNLPIKDLQLMEKIVNEMMFLAGYFNVPYDLIPFFGKSTYANQEQAMVSFYRNCIAPLAECLLEIGRYMIRKNTTALREVPSDVLTFTIDNVPELQDDRTADIEYKTKVAQMLKAVHDAGIDINEQPYIDMINEIKK